MREARPRLFLALIATCIIVLPAFAQEGADDLHKRIDELNTQVRDLEARRDAELGDQIDAYLYETAVPGADGEDDPLKGITLTAGLTALTLGTVGLEPSNSTVVNGNVMLRIDFQVTDSLKLYADMRAQPANASFPGAFPPLPGAGGGAPKTFSGESDLIGVDGTVGVYGSGRALNMYEAAIVWGARFWNQTVFFEWGALDPRTRFHQNALADSANSKFLNNVFTDTTAVLWLTDASGRSSLGLHLFTEFGSNKQWKFNTGWFNTGGTFWDKGQFFIQFSWRGEVADGEMNVRIFGFVDRFFRDAVNNEGSEGGGISFDWMVGSSFGVYATFATNNGEANPMKRDATLGVVFPGIFGRRPNDVLGIGFAGIRVNRDFADPAIALVPTSTEYTFELYYTLAFEDGRVQVTPVLMYVLDPGGNGVGWADDALIMLGIRVHVPF
jgi:hypothetical protein